MAAGTTGLVVSFSTNGDSWTPTGGAFIQRVRWVGTTGTAAGDDAVISSSSGGTELARFIATGANYSETVEIGQSWSKLKVTALDSGKLVLYRG